MQTGGLNIGRGGTIEVIQWGSEYSRDRRMTSALHPRGKALIIGLLFLVGFQGCAHTPPPSSRLESIQPQLGKIGVVVKSTGERKPLETPSSGRLSNLGRGAALGSGVGLYAGTLCLGGGAIVCSPVLAVAGAISGSIAGGLMSESGPLWKEAERAFETVLTDLALNEMILTHTIAYSRENGYDIEKLPAGAQRTEQDQSSDPSSPSDSVGAILEIRDPIVLLAPARFVINPPRRLILSAQIRLIRTADDTVLDDRIVTEEFGTTHSLAEWTADDAKIFREEVSLGAHRLAVTISEQEFILQRFPERRFSINRFYNGYFTGLGPVYPPMVGSGEFDQVDLVPIITSLQPTLQWEAFKGDDVTYDLMIRRAAWHNFGNQQVYNRERLTEPSHKVEIPLDPMTRYFWTVRARFSANGRTKVTEWSTRSVSASLFAKVFSLGLASLVGHPDDSTSGFYQFRTDPSLASESPHPDATQSKWFPWGNWPLSPPDSERQDQSTK
jgi:hypothetical protein